MKRAITALALTLTASGAMAADALNGPLQGDYSIYGCALGDTCSPTNSDAKVGIRITGPLAVEMFLRLGMTSRQTACVSAGMEIRRKNDLQCTRDEHGAVICDFGLDLSTGRMMNGSIC